MNGTPAGARERLAPAAAGAAVAGLVHTASFAPLGAWPLQVLALALLVRLMAAAGPRRAAVLGAVFGTAWLASGLWWLFISMYRFGGLPAPAAAGAVALLAVFLSVYYAAAAAAWAALFSRRSPGRRALGFSLCWTAAEWGRGVLLTGFPWLAGGYAHTDSPWAVWAPWVGVYGIGAGAAWLAAGLGLATVSRRSGAAPAGSRLVLLGAPLLVLAGGYALPADFTQPAGSLSVTLLQSDVQQDQKFDPARLQELLDWHEAALGQARGDLVVTPESSLPLPLAYAGTDTIAKLRRPFASGQRAALVGTFVGSDAEGFTNSLVALSADSDPTTGRYYRYGKRHLLPFGEFIPPGFGWFVQAMQIPISDQARGHSTEPLSVQGQRVRPLICYEDLFAEDIASSMVGEQAATVLANSTNLAWFGEAMVQDQHLQFSRMRSIEFQRPMVRATNTGATAAIDHRGQVLARLPAAVRSSLDVTVQGRVGSTPLARWLAAFGWWPLAGVWAVAMVAVGWPHRGRDARAS